MGSYTTIIHPSDGRELQIKTGGDVCDVYHLGDTVKWEVYHDLGGEGTLLDGVYPSYSDLGEDDWVVIKNHKIHSVASKNEKSLGELLEEFEITSPDPSLWSVEAWIKKDKITVDLEKWHASIKPLPPLEQLSAIYLRQAFLRRKMYEAVKDCFPVQPLPESSLLIYLKEPEEE